MLIERPLAYAALGLCAALAIPQWSAVQSGSGTHSPAELLVSALLGAMAVFLGVRLAQSYTDPRARRWRLILWGTISALIALFLLLVAIQVSRSGSAQPMSGRRFWCCSPSSIRSDAKAFRQ